MPRTELTILKPAGEQLPAALVAGVGQVDVANNLQARPSGRDFLVAWGAAGAGGTFRAQTPTQNSFLRRGGAGADDLVGSVGVGAYALLGELREQGFVDPTTGRIFATCQTNVRIVYVAVGEASPTRPRKLGAAAVDPARVSLNVYALPKPLTGAAPVVPITWVNGSTANGHRFLGTGLDLILARSNAAALTATVLAQTGGPLNRIENWTSPSITLAAGLHLLGPFGPSGWYDAGGYLNLTVSHADARLAVVKL